MAHSSADAAILAVAGLTNGAGWFNGDDAVVLTLDDAVIDSVGQVGFDPGSQWGSDLVSTADNTLTRKSAVLESGPADTDPNDLFDPSVQWDGHATNTFDVLHAASEPAEPTGPELLPIGAVQGTADSSPYVGRDVIVEGLVTGDFQEGGFNGFFIQDGGDDNPATSDGIFVYRGGVGVSTGQTVRVTGAVSEYNGLTEISPTSVEVLGSGQTVDPVEVALPLTDRESIESMLLTFPDDLTILEYYDYDRYGEIVYGTSRQSTPTAVVEPGADAQSLLGVNLANRIIVDDGRSYQNPTPAIHPNGEPFAADNYFRGGDLVSDITDVLTYSFGDWMIEPTQGANHTAVNERPEVPEVGGDLTVASMNVLNYFTTLTSESSAARGADTVEEFERQQAKIVAALAEMDADVVGLMEIENNGTAVENVVTALNSHLGAETYRAVNTGVVGSDAIIQAIIYKPASVQPLEDPAFLDYADGRNRPTSLQTFKEVGGPEKFNVAVNHLKSKGSACDADPDAGDGQGNCNLTRVDAAAMMTEWLASDPTGVGEARTLVIGDLNSYDHEDPIDVFADAGYTDLEKQYGGEEAYSYVFDGMFGYLDYALSNGALTGHVTGASAWHINADESDLFDYDMTYKQAGEDALWSADPVLLLAVAG